MMRLTAVSVTALVAWLAGLSGGPAAVDVGVVVEETAGGSAAVRSAARAEVSRLDAGGIDAELRVARSPSEALAAAAALAARGSDRLVLIDADPAAVVAVLRRERPEVRLEERVSRPR